MRVPLTFPPHPNSCIGALPNQPPFPNHNLLTPGIIGGALSCWNHPFEVARIEMQARSVAGQEKLGMLQVFRHVVKEDGIFGLFKGVIPRIGLGIWQTLFMVTGATIIKERFLS